MIQKEHILIFSYLGTANNGAFWYNSSCEDLVWDLHDTARNRPLYQGAPMPEIYNAALAVG